MIHRQKLLFIAVHVRLVFRQLGCHILIQILARLCAERKRKLLRVGKSKIDLIHTDCRTYTLSGDLIAFLLNRCHGKETHTCNHNCDAPKNRNRYNEFGNNR